MNITTKELSALLLKEESTNNFARRCRNVLEERPSVSIISTGPLPIDHVRRIYRLRAETSKEKGGVVEGFDELLRSLDKEDDQTIEIYGLEAEGEAFTVFTNPSFTKLLGVLISKEH